MNLALLENKDTEQLAEQIDEIVNTKSKEQLFEIIGRGLYDSGLEVSDSNFPEATMPIFSDNLNKAFLKSINFVEEDSVITATQARRKGKKLIARIKHEFCSNESIKKLFTGDGELKDYLKIIIPSVLAIVSSTLTLGTIGLAIAVSIIAIVIKSGYKSYCNL